MKAKSKSRKSYPLMQSTYLLTFKMKLLEQHHFFHPKLVTESKDASMTMERFKNMKLVWLKLKVEVQKDHWEN